MFIRGSKWIELNFTTKFTKVTKSDLPTKHTKFTKEIGLIYIQIISVY